MPVNTVFELFDTIIKPLLLYACEIWGSKMGSDIEKMHIKFIKTVLGRQSVPYPIAPHR